MCYGFGGTPALSLRDMYEVNIKEYDLAVCALASYQHLLVEMLDTMKEKPLA